MVENINKWVAHDRSDSVITSFRSISQPMSHPISPKQIIHYFVWNEMEAAKYIYTLFSLSFLWNSLIKSASHFIYARSFIFSHKLELNYEKISPEGVKRQDKKKLKIK